VQAEAILMQRRRGVERFSNLHAFANSMADETYLHKRFGETDQERERRRDLARRGVYWMVVSREELAGASWPSLHSPRQSLVRVKRK
jgi:hypothetical protein